MPLNEMNKNCEKCSNLSINLVYELAIKQVLLELQLKVETRPTD